MTSMVRLSRALLLVLAAAPFAVAVTVQGQKEEPKCEDVFQDIVVFKGVPASDLIPSMEFMAASLHFECTDCHDPKDYSASTRTKETARKMVLMQREINTKNFGGRNEVTCNSCHNGMEHPAGTPIPTGVALRHTRLENPPKAEDLIAKHVAAAGDVGGVLVLKGTLTAPNDATHKVETSPLEFIQAPGGKFRMVAGDRKVFSDGEKVWYGTMEMNGEPASIFNRIGRPMRGADSFTGLERVTVSGKDTLGKTPVVVVRASRPATVATQEFYFDTKSNLMSRMVNIRRSSLGNVVTAYDYANYKSAGGAKAPMKITVTFADGVPWIMDFKSAKVEKSVPDSTFKPAG